MNKGLFSASGRKGCQIIRKKINKKKWCQAKKKNSLKG